MAVFYVAASTDDCWRRLNADYWPALNVEYLAAGYNGVANKQWGAGMRFAGITIPKGSTILTAKLTLQAYESDTGTICNTRISAEAVDDAITFANDKVAFDARWANRTAQVDWNGIEGFTAGLDYDSVDFAAVIQAIVNREGWASGQAIVIFWEDFEDRGSGSGFRRVKSFDHADNAPPALTITWEEPEAVGGQGGPVALVAAGII